MFDGERGKAQQVLRLLHPSSHHIALYRLPDRGVKEAGEMIVGKINFPRQGFYQEGLMKTQFNLTHDFHHRRMDFAFLFSVRRIYGPPKEIPQTNFSPQRLGGKKSRSFLEGLVKPGEFVSRILQGGDGPGGPGAGKFKMGEKMFGSAPEFIKNVSIGRKNAEAARPNFTFGSPDGELSPIPVEVKAPEPLQMVALQRPRPMHGPTDGAKPRPFPDGQVEAKGVHERNSALLPLMAHFANFKGERNGID
jgi:hypothetical protein